MKTAANIGKLQSVGGDPKVTQAHGEALENAVSDDYVTKEFLSNKLETMETRIDAKIDSLESRIDAKFDNFKAQFYQAMFLQGIAIVGLTAGLIKLMK